MKTVVKMFKPEFAELVRKGRKLPNGKLSREGDNQQPKTP